MLVRNTHGKGTGRGGRHGGDEGERVILGEGFRPGVYEVLWGEAVAGHPGAISNVEYGERGQGQRCRLLTLGGPRDQKAVSRSVVRLVAM